jgi:hypothetical protein
MRGRLRKARVNLFYLIVLDNWGLGGGFAHYKSAPATTGRHGEVEFEQRTRVGAPFNFKSAEPRLARRARSIKLRHGDQFRRPRWRNRQQ